MPRNWSPEGFLVYCTSSFISVFLCPKSFVRFFVITSHLSVSYCQVYSYKHLTILYFCSNLSQREVQHMVTLLTRSFYFLPQVLRIWDSLFYSLTFFTSHSFSTFGVCTATTWFYRGFQFNLQGNQASCCGLKHCLGSTVCLNNTAISKLYI